MKTQYNFQDRNGEQNIQKVRQLVLSKIPRKEFRKLIQFQERTIQGGCINRVKNSCSNVDPDFRKTFALLQPKQQNRLYRKTLLMARDVIRSSSKPPQSNMQVQQQQQIQLFGMKIKSGAIWRSTRIIVRQQQRELQIRSKVYPASQYLLQQASQDNERVMKLLPLDGGQAVFLGSQEGSFQELQWRVQSLFDHTLRDYIISFMDIQKEKETLPTITQRCLLQNQCENEAVVVESLQRQSRQEDTYYTRFRHQTQPIRSKPSFFIAKGQLPYFLQKDWRMTKDGQLIVTNQQKLQNQSGVIKFIIKRLFSGSRLFSISLPVQVFHQQSNLSLLLHSYRNAPLILQQTKNDIIQRFKKVVQFSFTCPPCYIRCQKPFNPILGQTFQTSVAGALFYGQQISHHPPISAVLIKGCNFNLYGSLQAEVQFGINSATGNNKGWIHVQFKEQPKQTIRFTNVPGKMGGLAFGSRSLNITNSVYFIDDGNRLFCEIFYGRAQFTGTKEYNDSVQGKLWKVKANVDLKKPQKIQKSDMEQYIGLFHGRWLEKVYFQDRLLYDQRKTRPPKLEDCGGILPSDTTNRQDVKKMKLCKLEQCQQSKQKLQEIQRNDRLLRSKFKKEK